MRLPVQVFPTGSLVIDEQPVTSRMLPGRLEPIRSVPWSSVATTVIMIVSPELLGLFAATCETPHLSRRTFPRREHRVGGYSQS